MAKGTRICKVCGKEYEYCRTYAPNNGFRWQDVACCPEHGSIYFKQIMESRSKVESDKVADEAKDVEVADVSLAEASPKKTRKRSVKAKAESGE